MESEGRFSPIPMSETPEDARGDESPQEFAGVGAIRKDRFRSGGKGGQNVNKVETGVRLRATIVDPELLAALRERFPGSVTDAGELLIAVTAERSQAQNLRTAYERLAEKLAIAREKPEPRVPTKPPRAAKERRLEEKRRRGEAKELRKPQREW